MKQIPTCQWLLLLTSLSGNTGSTPRVRMWRALKEAGAATLRDGVSLLPTSDLHRATFREISKQIKSEGGNSWLFELPAQDAGCQAQLCDAFDRSVQYQEFQARITAQISELARLDEITGRRRLRQLERELEAIKQTDFFPDEKLETAQRMLEELARQINRHFSPQEPTAVNSNLEPLKVEDFQRRLWATRKHLWVDRVACAWLIRRFIDQHAQFRWLDHPQDCPENALGFDFDGASFTHADDFVSFEVLMTRFGLAEDPGLTQLGRMVHYLDVGGTVAAEAAGFEAILHGLRGSTAGDDALLNAISPVLDALYHRFSTLITNPSPT